MNENSKQAIVYVEDATDTCVTVEMPYGELGLRHANILTSYAKAFVKQKNKMCIMEYTTDQDQAIIECEMLDPFSMLESHVAVAYLCNNSVFCENGNVYQLPIADETSVVYRQISDALKTLQPRLVTTFRGQVFSVGAQVGTLKEEVLTTAMQLRLGRISTAGSIETENAALARIIVPFIQGEACRFDITEDDLLYAYFTEYANIHKLKDSTLQPEHNAYRDYYYKELNNVHIKAIDRYFSFCVSLWAGHYWVDVVETTNDLKRLALQSHSAKQLNKIKF